MLELWLVVTTPKIYEINTAVYLHALGQSLGGHVTLNDIPDSAIDHLAELGFNTVWLMGVWQRSDKAIEVNKSDIGFMEMLANFLPEFTHEDLIGSAYSIKEYVVNPDFGGDEAMLSFRKRLNDRGMILILDFVPNHTGPDHPWTGDSSEVYIAVSQNEAKKKPSFYFITDRAIYAKGRDPSYAPWSDVLQLNAFSPVYRQLTKDTLRRISRLCDGVRCDMAMLQLNRIFENTWGSKVGAVPQTEYWEETIGAIKAENPDFLFIAEAYWGTQKELIDLGFDYCYDKELLDFLAQGNSVGLHDHLKLTAEYRSRLIGFIENHDEQRAAAIFEDNKSLAAAVSVLTLPGGHLVYDGQLEGRTQRTPVHIRRAPSEPANSSLQESYHRILAIIKSWQLGDRTWHYVETGKEDVYAWVWHSNDTHCLVVINFSPAPTTINLNVNGLTMPATQLTDRISLTDIAISPREDGYALNLSLDPWHIILGS